MEVTKKTFIVAEMSANHLQNKDRTFRIIDAAVEAGADAIKLQTYRPDTITIDCQGKEFMATDGSPWEGRNLYQLYQEAYMPWEWQKDIFTYANKQGLVCFSAPFDLSAIQLLEQLDNPIYKIASFEIQDIPLIQMAAKTKKPMIISTGIATIQDIDRAVRACREVGNKDITLLRCVSAYPAKFEDMNIRMIQNLKETFDVKVGLSDHTLGSEVAVASVALGAEVIEKHFTLNRSDGGPDAEFSMEPGEFKEMVYQIRHVEKALGKITYELTEQQKRSRDRGRSLYVVHDIKEGEKFTEDNLKSIRPAYGLEPRFYYDVLGKYAACNLQKGTGLRWEYIKR